MPAVAGGQLLKGIKYIADKDVPAIDSIAWIVHHCMRAALFEGGSDVGVAIEGRSL